MRGSKIRIIECAEWRKFGMFYDDANQIEDLKVDVKGAQKIRSKMAKTKKVKITINIEEDILAVVRKEADSSGVPYQILINHLLR